MSTYAACNLEFKIIFHKLVPKCPDTLAPVPKVLRTFRHWCRSVLVPKCPRSESKTRSKGAWSTSCDLLFKFWDPLYISRIDKVRNFKFGVRVDRRAFKPKKCKSRSRGACYTSRDLLFVILEPPLYLWNG